MLNQACKEATQGPFLELSSLSSLSMLYLSRQTGLTCYGIGRARPSSPLRLKVSVTSQQENFKNQQKGPGSIPAKTAPYTAASPSLIENQQQQQQQQACREERQHQQQQAAENEISAAIPCSLQKKSSLSWVRLCNQWHCSVQYYLLSFRGSRGLCWRMASFLMGGRA